MNTYKFKTNAKCGGCEARMAGVLNQKAGVEKWSLDLLSPDKVLTVETSLPANEIALAITALGFKVEQV